MVKIATNPLILVDGSSYLYRAYHAFPPLSNAVGEPTGAMYGMLNMLRSLLRQYQPSHLAVVFDPKGKTLRHALYADYKNHRPTMPPDLHLQIEPLYEIIRAMGLVQLVVPEVEADDVIGTLTAHAIKQGKAVLISTGDKDMAQLVNSQVTLINTMTNKIQGPAEIQETYGVSPALIVDLLALMGDASDNIPGIPGIGKKRALALLQGIGDLQQIYANLPQVADLSLRGAKTLAANLGTHREIAELSYRLATIKTDVALAVTPAELLLRSPDLEKLCLLFERYEFKRWLVAAKTGQLWGDYQSAKTVGNPAKPPISDADAVSVTAQPHYTLILDEATLNHWIEKLRAAALIAIASKTDRSDTLSAKLVGLSLAVAAGEAAYLPCGHDYPGVTTQLTCDMVLAKLKPLLEDESLPKVGHDIKFDQQVLAHYNIKLCGVVFDSMLAGYLLNSVAGRYDIHNLALRYLKYETTQLSSIAGKRTSQLTFNQIPLEQAARYAGEEADVALQLYHALWPQLQQHPSLMNLFSTIEMPVASVLARMEQHGVLIDIPLLQSYSKVLAAQIKACENSAYQLAGEPFNLSSPKQLQQILFDKQGLPCSRKTPGGAPSTDEAVLSQLALNYPLPAILLRYRSLSKLKTTYTDPLPQMVHPVTARVHTNYHQAITTTGRLSSSDPNLQNIPIRTPEGRRIRQAFIASAGCQLLSADYSQIELRIMAHISGDPGLRQAFVEDRDVHCATASELFDVPLALVSTEQRRRAKTINFGLIYGMSSFGLARQLEISRAEAQAYLERYFERYPGVLAYMQRTRYQAAEQGYVETIFGRRLYLPEIKSPNALRRQAAERAAINAPMQGSAADIIKCSMIAIDNWLQQQTNTIHMVMQVHDELVFEVENSAVASTIVQIRNLMAQSAQLSIPLKVDIGVGSNWDEAH